MDAIFIDQSGHKKNFLYQYDIGQSFVVEDFEYTIAPKVQFQIKSLKVAPTVNSKIKEGNLIVSIPDTLLTYGDDIAAYLYIKDSLKGNVVETVFISVVPRKLPADYNYTSEMFTRTINGTTISENFGYSDVAEWDDKNTNKENRVGYFVTARFTNNNLTINKATSISNVYGVTVQAPGFASNCDLDYLGYTGDLLSRYSYVCSYGYVSVIDNGRCSVGGICVPSPAGIAMSSSSVGYKVLSRINSTHVLIFIGPTMDMINKNENALNSHVNNKSNPHSVTASQVGLGSVPNVTTNDQTPTYTEASILTKLISGEKLSTAFSKISKAITDFIAHVANKNNPHSVTKAQVGLGNCDNTSDTDKPISTAQLAENKRIEDLANTAQNDINVHSSRVDNPHAVTKTQVGLGNCDNTSDINKPVSTAQAESIADAKKAGTDAQSSVGLHKEDVNNPHKVTKAQVGLSNCDNTSDKDKPISTAQSAEFARIEGLITNAQGSSDTHFNRTDNPHSVTKAQVGLSNCDNTSDADKPVSTAQATSIADAKKAGTDAQNFINSHKEDTNNPHKVTKTQVGLGNCDNTSDANKPISTATQTALNKKADLGDDGLISSAQLPSTMIPKAHANSHFAGGDDAIYSTITINLTVEDWTEHSQTVDAAGVTANNIVVVSPSPLYHDLYTKSGVKCLSQATGKLTFSCKLTPENPIVVNVLILGVNS